MAIVRSVVDNASERRRLSLANPATLEPLGEIEVQSAAEVRDAVGRARKAQPEWAALSFDQRARYLRRALAILLDEQDRYVDVIVSESGKPRTEARSMAIFAASDLLTYYAKRAERLLRPQKLRLHGVMRVMKRCRIVYRPLGVIGVITPWNGPFVLSINPTAQALMAGNCVVLKPSEVTPRSGALVGELFRAAGLPEGVLEIVTGDGETGAALVEAGVDKISFTGSVATGRRVGEACARQLIPCTLELGGKDPMIVCADADLDRAAGAAVAGAFFNAGHYCSGTERVYVVESVADEFTERVVERTGKLRQGVTGEFDVGAVFWQDQLEIIEHHVNDAVERGARVLAGGRRHPELKGLFYEPTVLAGVTHEMQVMRDETFGPVLPIMRVADEDEAVRMANDCRYGLGAMVWTRDTRRGFELARRIDAGGVCINDMSMVYGVLEAPFGGMKESGVGQVNGETGLKGYCFAQPILTDRFGGRQTADRYPYSAKADEGLRRFARTLYGGPLGRWLS
ncbi:MAG: aldehyde dehydrogenase family protein [Myxococcales bacterium]|nr:aldehyde dehydrogenase family protein [Myxococcales bacterium]